MNSCGFWSSCVTVLRAAHCNQKAGSWRGGDGTSSSERYIGDYGNREQCVCAVRRRFPRANGVTYSAPGRGRRCYAEFGWRGQHGGSSSWQTVPVGRTCGSVFASGCVSPTNVACCAVARQGSHGWLSLNGITYLAKRHDNLQLLNGWHNYGHGYRQTTAGEDAGA